MIRSISSVILCCVLSICQSQPNPSSNWHFGIGAQLVFSGQNVSANNLGSTSWTEGVTSLSSDDGALLFYAQNQTIWNRYHQVMPNGSGLALNYTATQGAISFKDPSMESLYHLFTIDLDGSPSTGNWRLHHSEVDMSLDGGNGDVVVATKNLHLTDSITEQITFTSKCGSLGYWVVVKEKSSSAYLVYSVGPSGLDTVPQVYNGLEVPGSFFAPAGQMKISPNKELLAFVSFQNKRVEIVHFDAQSGSISPFVVLDVELQNALPYGVEFSSDSKYLYATCMGGAESYLLQYDASLNDSALIQSSCDTLLHTDTLLASLQLASDQRIYIATNDSFIGRIEYPNQEGTSALASTGDMYLNGGFSGLGLPQFDFFQSVNPISFDSVCANDSFDLFFPNGCADSIQWSFGDGSTLTTNLDSSRYAYADEGKFQVSMLAFMGADTLTFLDTIVVLPTSTNTGLPDTILSCDVDSMLLSVPFNPYVQIVWSTGAADTTIVVNSSGLYWLNTSNRCFSQSDTIRVIFQDSIIPFSLPDTTLCSGDSFTLSIKAPEGTQYQWSDGTTSQNYSYVALADSAVLIRYHLTLKNQCNSLEDSGLINILPKPRATLPKDSNICGQDVATFVRPAIPGVNYEWAGGDTALSIAFTNDTTLHLMAFNQCGNDTQTMTITRTSLGPISLGKDTTICPGDTLRLSVAEMNDSVTWYYNEEPITLAQNHDHILVISEATVPSSAESMIVQNEPLVMYSVKVSLGTCSLVDNRFITISETACPDRKCAFSYPNVFTPNSDGQNDLFTISSTCTRPDFRMFIYNRWGQLVFETIQWNHTWDGTMNGVPASEGTYYVVLESADQSIRGSFQLLR